jgi:hypothetical protein
MFMMEHSSMSEISAIENTDTMSIKMSSPPNFPAVAQPSSYCQGFIPNDYDVMYGRGKGNYNQPGNIKYREIIVANLGE